MSTLREAQREATRVQIVDALLTLLETDPPASISMAAVADAAGVSLRTLYRYFPSKSDLLDAAGGWFDERIRHDRAHTGVNTANLLEYQRGLWTEFGRHVAAVRAQHQSPAGREIRGHRLAQQRAEVAVALQQLGTELDPDDRTRLIDAAIATVSSSMFLELTDRMGHDPVDGADLAVWMIEAMVTHAARTNTTRPAGFGDPS
ncbi:MAG: TetR/AcrR family transcriptional regulator [Acidimicrobiia bacterium]|nr:TetR/AcrR family transcriptional regulator [Acidimicrobiia bacterium]MDH5236265.1 TetR/AcrR family transcriptional regulator [Acidimicrobiia bacterium]